MIGKFQRFVQSRRLDIVPLRIRYTSIVSNDWPGIKEQSFRVKKRVESKRVYVFTNGSAFATGHHKESFLVMSIECLGKTPGDNGGLMYTLGPNHCFKHFSPLIGRLAGTKDQVPSQISTNEYTILIVQLCMSFFPALVGIRAGWTDLYLCAHAGRPTSVNGNWKRVWNGRVEQTHDA